MPGIGRVAAGSLIGAALAALAAPYLKPLFSPPDGGVGLVTVSGYVKGWDYLVVAVLVIGAAVGGLLAVVGYRLSAPDRETPQTTDNRQLTTIAIAILVFLTMLAIHDHPFAHMDPFHEGEHHTPAYLFLNGERPYADVFLLHGLAVDGGLDALVGGNALHARRLQTVLDAATLALLVPIAAELTVTTLGLVSALVLSLCGVAALWLPVFPYFRLAPLLLAVLALLRFARSRRFASLVIAYASAALGVVWSLDVGTYAVAAAALTTLVLRPRVKDVAVAAAIAIALPLIVLLAARADVRQFVVDSYAIIPSAIDAVWSLPAPEPFTAAGVRYYVPPIFYGFLIALAIRSRDPRIAIVAIFSILLFRTAAGRVSWSHTRFAVPLLGIAFVAFVLEPLYRRSASRIAVALLAIAAIFYCEVPQNFAAGAKLIAQWPARQRHEGLVRHPLVRGIYTSEDNATQVATLKSYVDSLGPGTIFDFTNERALYAMLKRKPATRCFDVPMLSSPRLLDEALSQLEAAPPVAVILGGEPAVAAFDGLPNHVRVPRLAAWIDANYTKRTQLGRFTVATR
jgi:hypothetical protein